jgi:hypothetical protein
MVAIMSIVCLYVPTQEKVQNPGFGHGKVYLNKKLSYGFTQFSIGLVRLLSLWSASSPAREGLSGETRVGGIRGNVKFGAARRKPHARTGAWGRGWQSRTNVSAFIWTRILLPLEILDRFTVDFTKLLRKCYKLRFMPKFKSSYFEIHQPLGVSATIDVHTVKTS